MIRSFADILALWRPRQLARVLGVPYSTAHAMYQRGSIGPAHWVKLMRAAKARGEVITPEMLVKFADHHRNRDRSPALSSRVGKHSTTLPSPVAHETTQNV